jgi:predicted RNA-binding Zn-ribbon protein involved in translation (DUF1610 family)
MSEPIEQQRAGNDVSVSKVTLAKTAQPFMCPECGQRYPPITYPISQKNPY